MTVQKEDPRERNISERIRQSEAEEEVDRAYRQGDERESTRRARRQEVVSKQVKHIGDDGTSRR